MKKLTLLIFMGTLLLFLVSCSNTTESNSSSNLPGNDKTVSTSSDTDTLSKVTKDVYLREGTANNGTPFITSDDIIGFYSQPSENNHTYQIVFQLTDKGKKALADETTKLSQTGGSVTFWIGDDKVVTLVVAAPITDGTFAIAKSNADDAKSICDQLQAE